MDTRLALFLASGVLAAAVSGVLPWFFKNILGLSRNANGSQQYNYWWYSLQGGSAGIVIALFLILYSQLRKPPVPKGVVVTRIVLKWMTMVMMIAWMAFVAINPAGDLREIIQTCVLHLLLWSAVSWALMARLELELGCDTEEDLEQGQQARLLWNSGNSFVSMESDL